MPQPAQRVGPAGRCEKSLPVGRFVVVLGRHGIPRDGDGVVIDPAALDLHGRWDVQKFAAAEVGIEQGLDPPPELSVSG